MKAQGINRKPIWEAARVAGICACISFFSCGGDFYLGDSGVDALAPIDADDHGDTSPDADEGGADGDIDADAGVDADADADADEPPILESCDFGYGEMFPTSLFPPDDAVDPPAWSDRERWAANAPVDTIAHDEPAPPYTFELAPKDPDDPDLVMPGYTDTMPLFERARSWDTETRCFETPLGAVLLTEPEAYELYRDVAELTTGVPIDDQPGVRTVVGLRGAYPGTFLWHGNTPDYFNDTLALIWLGDDGAPHVREFPVNTDVGARNFGVDSSSSLRPDRRYYYINGWHNDYNALHIDEYGYRVRDDTNNNGHWDDDRNGWLPPRTADDRDRTGGGHNIHMGSVDGPLGTAHVNGWSAGCQVIPGLANWTEFIFRAWTQMGDRLNYFLIDARDIEPEVWEPCVERDGSHRCPLRIDGFPFTDARDTAGWGVDEFDAYNCATATDESGPEFVYLMTIDRSGTLSVSVDCPEGVDIDVHLLDGDDPNACLERAHISFEYAITPGRYLIIADSFVDGGIELSGAYTLHVDLS